MDLLTVCKKLVVFIQTETQDERDILYVDLKNIITEMDFDKDPTLGKMVKDMILKDIDNYYNSPSTIRADVVKQHLYFIVGSGIK